LAAQIPKLSLYHGARVPSREQRQFLGETVLLMGLNTSPQISFSFLWLLCFEMKRRVQQAKESGVGVALEGSAAEYKEGSWDLEIVQITLEDHLARSLVAEMHSHAMSPIDLAKREVRPDSYRAARGLICDHERLVAP
jgi:lipoprotein NlpI